MDKACFCRLIADYTENTAENYIAEDIALSPELSGLKIFETPAVFIGAAADPMFDTLKSAEGIGAHFLKPEEWLSGAESVISIFLPFTEKIKKSNIADRALPSREWLHGRIEGQQFINGLARWLVTVLQNEGYSALAPCCDSRFWSKTDFDPSAPHPAASFTSNWSERHAAFVCGAGTFGLSKGLITPRGISAGNGRAVYQHRNDLETRCG